MARPKLVGSLMITAPVLVGILLAPAAESAQRSARPAGCDTGRHGVAHFAGGARVFTKTVAVPCITYTFTDYGEANIVQTSDGTVLHGGTYDTTSVLIGTGGLARSSDRGAHWTNIQLPARSTPPETKRGPGDPRLWRDPITNRVYYTTIGGADVAETTLCQTDISYSDDNGRTWVNNPDPTLWGCPAFDFPQPFTGPPTTKADIATLRAAPRKNAQAYPNVLYVCKSSHLVVDRQCWKSLDGGRSFEEIGGSPAADQAGNMGAATTDLHGNLYGIANGTLNVSRDEGLTWSQIPLPAGFSGVLNIPPQPMQVDRNGNVYVGGIVGGLPQVTYLRAPYDAKHPHWIGPFAVQMPGATQNDPGVRHVEEMGLAVGKPGQVAVGYVGNSDASDTPDAPDGYHQGGPHHAYLTTTGDLFARRPLFESVQVDSDKHPLLPYGYPAVANTSVSPSRADYVGVTIGPSGQVWGYFFRDDCATPDACNGQNPGSNPAQIWSNWRGAVATMVVTRPH